MTNRFLCGILCLGLGECFMGLETAIFILSLFLTALIIWAVTAKIYQSKIVKLKCENIELKSQINLNENIINQIKAEFSQIAQESLKSQQEQLLLQHSTDLKTKIDLFKAEEITPINKLLRDFKESIDLYQKSHEQESSDIKNAIATAEKYAKALTTNQNSKGRFGEDWLEQILKFANLTENIHYTKQFESNGSKPDFIINLPNDNKLIIDSKVILKNYIEYRQTEDNNLKKSFALDLNNCINLLAKKNYEEIPEQSQPKFILMFIPIETCVNMIYSDYEFRSIIENANAKNIIIVGSSSLLVTLRLVNQLWAENTQNENIKNIIKVGEALYNNVAVHAQNLLNIQKVIEGATQSIQTEINRFVTRNNGSIFKEAEKLKEYGIGGKSVKSGRKIGENFIPKELLQSDTEEEHSFN